MHYALTLELLSNCSFIYGALPMLFSAILYWNCNQRSVMVNNWSFCLGQLDLYSAVKCRLITKFFSINTTHVYSRKLHMVTWVRRSDFFSVVGRIMSVYRLYGKKSLRAWFRVLELVVWLHRVVLCFNNVYFIISCHQICDATFFISFTSNHVCNNFCWK